MRKSKFSSLVLVLCILTLVLSGCGKKFSTVSGIVTRSHDDLPLAGAVVSIGDAIAFTDRTGAFSLVDVERGSYAAIVSMGGKQVYNAPVNLTDDTLTLDIEVQITDGVIFAEGFEHWTTGNIGSWSTYSSNPYGGVTTAQAHSGKQSLMLESPGGANAGLWTVHIPVVGGKTYRATYWSKLTAGDTTNYVRYLDADDKIVSGTNTAYSENVIGSEWKQVTWNLPAAPENATSMLMLFYFPSAKSGTLYVDDIEVYEVL